jgi:hypothetical protein
MCLRPSGATGSEADEARDRLKAIAGYRAEFGTARSQQLADRERDALTMRFGKDLRQVVVLEPDANDRNYRITSAPMSERDASAACETIKHASRSCTRAGRQLAAGAVLHAGRTLSRFLAPRSVSTPIHFAPSEP